MCVFVGTGLVTIRLEPTAAAGAKTFGLIAGSCLFALAVLSVVTTQRKRLRRTSPPVGGSGIGAFPAATVSPAGMPAFQLPPAEPAAITFDADPLDRIAKLAKLRDSGALTEDEFEREKAKLLSQM